MLLLSYSGDLQILTKEERWLKDVCSIPRAKIRIRCLMEKFDFESDFSSFFTRLKLYNEPFIVFVNDFFFQGFLNTSLRVSNYLNHGTKKGEAHGMNLDSIKRFDNIKATGTKVS